MQSNITHVLVTHYLLLYITHERHKNDDNKRKIQCQLNPLKLDQWNNTVFAYTLYYEWLYGVQYLERQWLISANIKLNITSSVRSLYLANHSSYFLHGHLHSQLNHPAGYCSSPTVALTCNCFSAPSLGELPYLIPHFQESKRYN